MLPHAATVLATVSLLWIAAVATPGPDFLLMTRVSLTQGKPAALRAALGIAIGIGTWGVAGFFGIHALFVASPWLYVALKLGGGLYLFVLGVRLVRGSWHGAGPAADMHGSGARATAFRVGLLTNLANPKAPLFVSSLFAATMPQHPPVALGLAAVGLMVAITVCWYGLLAHLLSVRRFTEVFRRATRWIDRVAGVAFMGIGAGLAFERGG